MILSQSIMAQDTVSSDTSLVKLKKKEIKKAQRKLERKQMTQHFNIGIDVMYAFLNSSARFEGVNGIFSAQLNFEDLGFQNSKIIYSGSLIYRITPRSGIYGAYYQLNNFEIIIPKIGQKILKLTG